jgi:hypothetical protein
MQDGKRKEEKTMPDHIVHANPTYIMSFGDLRLVPSGMVPIGSCFGSDSQAAMSAARWRAWPPGDPQVLLAEDIGLLSLPKGEPQTR